MTNDIAKKEEILFIETFEKYSDAVFCYCYERLFDREKAKSSMQEVFQMTWTHMTQGKEISNIQAFLYSISDEVINSSRKRKTPVRYFIHVCRRKLDNWYFRVHSKI